MIGQALGGSLWAGLMSGCNHFELNDCYFYNPAGGSAYDVFRMDKNVHYGVLNRCIAESNSGTSVRYHDGFELWGPCTHLAFNECIAFNIRSEATGVSNGFEVYGDLAAEICNDIVFTNCEAYNCGGGLEVSWGPDAGHPVHLGIVADGCSFHDNVRYGYNAGTGQTITRENVASGDNTNNGIAETTGNVVDNS